MDVALEWLKPAKPKYTTPFVNKAPTSFVNTEVQFPAHKGAPGNGRRAPPLVQLGCGKPSFYLATAALAHQAV